MISTNAIGLPLTFILLFLNYYTCYATITSTTTTTPSPPTNTSTPSPTAGLELATATVLWTGGKIECNVSECPFWSTPSADYQYACMPDKDALGRGDWDNGTKMFMDPLPGVVDVQLIGFILYGEFNCDQDSVSSPNIELDILIQDTMIAFSWVIEAQFPDACQCGFCIMNVTMAPIMPPVEVPYNVSGLNQLRINPQMNTMCLSRVDIQFYYLPHVVPPRHGLSIKEWIIITSSICGGSLVSIIAFVWARKKIARMGYKELKDGKNIDISEIKIGDRVGKGNFGEVYKGYWRGVIVAIKKLPAHNVNDAVLREFHKEIELMRNLRHPNVIQFLGSCTISPNICICTEFMPRGSLYGILHDQSLALSWTLIKRLCIDAVRGIVYLHNSVPVILHRDLKSHNLLVDDSWKLKVGDFGLSAIEQTNTMTACGTPCWTAPEVLRNQRYTDRADVYSFGIVMWECATRSDPYYGMPAYQVIFAVGREGLRPTLPPSLVPPEFIQLITECWSENPENRPTMEEILGRLESLDTTDYPPVLCPGPSSIN
eukprot:gene20952-25152_t